MIKWLRAKYNPVPRDYDVLLFCADGTVKIARIQGGENIEAWALINWPDWISAAATKKRLTDADCQTIKKLHDDGLSYMQIAIKFECGRSTVRDIVTNRRRFKI